jgi:hypothetical protein
LAQLLNIVLDQEPLILVSISFGCHSFLKIYLSLISILTKLTIEFMTTIIAKENYFLSKFKNSMASTMSPSKSKRFYDPSLTSKIAPGPGFYSPTGDFTKDGSYFVSKFRSSMCRTHYHFERKTLAGAKIGKI